MSGSQPGNPTGHGGISLDRAPGVQKPQRADAIPRSTLSTPAVWSTLSNVTLARRASCTMLLVSAAYAASDSTTVISPTLPDATSRKSAELIVLAVSQTRVPAEVTLYPAAVCRAIRMPRAPSPPVISVGPVRCCGACAASWAGNETRMGR